MKKLLCILITLLLCSCGDKSLTDLDGTWKLNSEGTVKEAIKVKMSDPNNNEDVLSDSYKAQAQAMIEAQMGELSFHFQDDHLSVQLSADFPAMKNKVKVIEQGSDYIIIAVKNYMKIKFIDSDTILMREGALYSPVDTSGGYDENGDYITPYSDSKFKAQGVVLSRS